MLAILFLILTVVLFFVLKIPKVFGVVSGRTEKKAIQEIRESGYASNVKKESSSRKKKVETIHAREASDTEQPAETSNVKPEVATSVTDNMTPQATQVGGFRDTEPNVVRKRSKRTYDDAEETELLSATPVSIEGGEEGTEVLKDESEEETALLFDADVAGGVIDDYDAPTDVLTGNANVGDSEAETDVLKVSNDESEDSDAETEVLSGDSTENVETISMESEDIVGRYSPEETAVLRSTDKVHTAAAAAPKEEKKIVVIYKETVVHTDETLV